MLARGFVAWCTASSCMRSCGRVGCSAKEPRIASSRTITTMTANYITRTLMRLVFLLSVHSELVTSHHQVWGSRGCLSCSLSPLIPSIVPPASASVWSTCDHLLPPSRLSTSRCGILLLTTWSAGFCLNDRNYNHWTWERVV